MCVNKETIYMCTKPEKTRRFSSYRILAASPVAPLFCGRWAGGVHSVQGVVFFSLPCVPTRPFPSLFVPTCVCVCAHVRTCLVMYLFVWLCTCVCSPVLDCVVVLPSVVRHQLPRLWSKKIDFTHPGTDPPCFGPLCARMYL